MLTWSLSSIAKQIIPSKEHVKRKLELMDVNAQIDSDVSPKGDCQIKNLAQPLEKDDFITKYNVSLIAHFPLKRAKWTCKGINYCYFINSWDLGGNNHNDCEIHNTATLTCNDYEFLNFG